MTSRRWRAPHAAGAGAVLLALAAGRAARTPSAAEDGRRVVERVDDPGQPVPAEGDAALLRLHQAGRPLRRAAAEGRLPPAVGHGLPGRPAASTCATAPQGQDRHLPVRGAQAHPDRRLPRQQGPHHHRPSRTSSRRRRPRSGSTASTTRARRGGWRRSSSEMLEREGPALRAPSSTTPRTSAAPGTQVSFIDRRRARARRSRRSSSTGNEVFSDGAAAPADEEDQAGAASGT